MLDLYAGRGHYEQIAKPFRWTFTRRDLAKLLARLDTSAKARLAA